MKDTVEFYLGWQRQPFLIVDSSIAPNEGELVSIRGETWKVIGRSFAVDYADQRTQRSMRCNLIVEKVKP